MTQEAKNKLATTNRHARVKGQTATTKKMRHHKNHTSRKTFPVEQFTTIAAFILICLLIGAGLASAF